MRRKISTFLLFLIGGTIFLTLGFYNNNWKVVEPKHYERWEMTYERVVVAPACKISTGWHFFSRRVARAGEISMAGILIPIINTMSCEFRNKF